MMRTSGEKRSVVGSALGDQRGIAFALAMMALLVLSALMIAFTMLSQSEPIIGGNHLRGVQARALAESGLERALWALSNSTNPSGIPDPMPGSPLPSPAYDTYNGNSFTPVSGLGGFKITVTAGGAVNQRNILTEGWAPNTGAGASHRRIQATATKINLINPPCAFCVRSAVTTRGNFSVDSSADTNCGRKWAGFGTGAFDVGGASGFSSPTGLDPYVQNQSTSTFDGFVFNSADLNMLKAIAQAQGTYYRGSLPGSGAPNGLIFVDTTDGNPITSVNKATVRFGPGSFQSTPFQGWVISMGDIDISGRFTGFRGMMYAVNDIISTGGGSSRDISGLMVAQEILGGSIFARGNVHLTYNCNDAKGAGFIPTKWFVQPGSFKEPSG